MALAITTATLAMMTVHEALNVAIDTSPPRAGLPWQQQQQQQQQLQQQSGRLSEVVPHRLLLATHNVLAWYYPQYDTMEELHRGEGVHYGMFPGEPVAGHPRTLWNVLRPHNWRPTSEQEHLVQFDADTGMELARVQLPTRFTHDAIRMGERVYVCSTGDGSILELSYPGMKLLRKMHLFSEADHPNTLAAADDDHLWVMLHNLGPSDLVKVYVGPSSPPHEVSRIRNIGSKAHGLVAWGRQGQQQLILLDSDNAALVSLDPATGDEVELWQVPEEGKFLKGLAVLDDIAYFGITTWSHRSVRDSADSHGELAAFDLMRNKLLWRRVVHTSGLLNIIGAPHLAPDSTYVASYTRTLVPPTVMQASHLKPLGPLVLPDSAAMVDAAVAHLAAAGHHPPRLGPTNYWSSGWPRLDIEPKLTSYAEAAGLQLPLFHADISALKAKLLAMPPAMWSKEEQAVSNAVMNGRNSNMERFKPGVDGMVLLFSDNNGEVVYQFPYYEYFKAELEPLLHEILGPADARNIVRIQFALMKPGTNDIR
ncbi:hypothetical protein OEZ86_014294 [Tetradesmus obliquus]|nr:hypothetical protein OEZ86_014294 [Tetradesmus obliquus]